MTAAAIDAALAASPLAALPGLHWRPGLPTVASPMRQAVDADNAVVEPDGIVPVFLKVYRHEVPTTSAVASEVGSFQARRHAAMSSS